MVEKGIQLRREHRDAEALAEFRRADQLNPAPRIRAQIGLAEQALAQWVEAEKDLKRSLSSQDDPWIRDHADALQKALAAIQQHLGSLSLEANVPGAEVWINGASVGTLPVADARVVAGTVNVQVRSPGYQTALRAIDVPPGSTAAERFILIPAPASSTDRRIDVTPIPASDTPPPPSTQRMLAWGSLGAAAAVLGAAVAAQIVNQVDSVHYNDDNQCLVPNKGTRDEQCGPYRWRAETARTFAYIGYAGAGAFGIASAVLFWTAPPARRPKSTGMWVDAGPDRFVVGWHGAL